jgi:hypothetical protein
MFDPAKCLEKVKAIDPSGQLCDPSLCSEPQVADQIRKFCNCQPPYPPQNPCPYGPDQPVIVYTTPTGGTCFCCCGQVDARVAVDAGEARDLGDVWVGQMVRVAKRAN